MAPEIARLDAQIRHLESVQAEVLHLLEENERLQQERNELLDVFARIAELLGRQPC
jgi:regulator of replication initiation timing